MSEIIRNPEIVQLERRQQFDGYAPPSPARANRPFRKRKVSTFTILFALCLLSVTSVLYVSNIIAVNNLAAEINALKTSYTNTENMNELLRLEISRKTSMERITKIALEEMGMVFPTQPPVWFELEEIPDKAR